MFLILLYNIFWGFVREMDERNKKIVKFTPHYLHLNEQLACNWHIRNKKSYDGGEKSCCQKEFECKQFTMLLMPVIAPLPVYELLAISILNATFLQHCPCLHVALTGNPMESLVLSALATFCPMLTSTLGIKPDIQTESSLIVADNPEYVKQVSRKYSSIIMFYTGQQMILDTDRSLAVLAVVQEKENFIALDAADKTVLGKWNPDTNLVATVKSPWLQAIRKARMKRLRAPKVAIFECPPYVIYENTILDEDDNIHYDGIELRISQAALRDFNVSLRAQNTSIWGGSWEKIIEDLASGEADVGVCSMWISNHPPYGIEYSSPWSRQIGTWMAPKPQPLPRALLLYLPLQFWTWIILLNTLLGFGIILHCIAKLLPSSSRYQNMHHCFLDATRILMFNSVPKFPQQVSLRYMLTAWAFFSLLITTVYSSGFTSLLTSPLYSDPIDTIQDLLDHNIYWGEESYDFNDIIMSSHNPKLQEFGQRFVTEKSPTDREKRILEGKYAIFCKVLSNVFVTETERLSPKARQILRVMEEPIFTFYVGIGLRENSPYKSYFDSTITRLQQGGFIDFWQHTMINKLGYHFMNNFFSLQNGVTDRKPLSLDSVQGAFCLLGIGLVVAGFVFLSEIVKMFMHSTADYKKH